ncbi:MAG: signal peptidase II [Spirochaetia bacterium]|nr:signal peptidase II [Treponema sp.]MCI6545341.1 signal peptidase II [Spirochaetia bacterium]
MEKIDKKLLMPFILTFAVIIADQITKCLVVKYIEPWTIGAQFFGDILRIVRVANNGVAFSMGDSLSLIGRRLCFGLVPVIIMGLVIGVYFRNKEFTMLQRWAICGVVGGGIGNIIDRIFRVEGVIDFIDVKFYGIFGLQRWPTFNVADMAVVICGIMLIISFVVITIQQKKNEGDKQ